MWREFSSSFKNLLQLSIPFRCSHWKEVFIGNGLILKLMSHWQWFLNHWEAFWNNFINVPNELLVVSFWIILCETSFFFGHFGHGHFRPYGRPFVFTKPLTSGWEKETDMHDPWEDHLYKWNCNCLILILFPTWKEDHP